MKTLGLILLSAVLAAGGQEAGSAPASFCLADETPVELRLLQTVSSAHARVGDRVHFEVLEEVRLYGVVVIQKGAIASATVTAAQKKRRLGRAGKLEMNIDSVRLADGEKAALRSTEQSEGDNKKDGVVVGAVISAVVFWPAAAMMLMHGDDISMPDGTEITAYVAGDMNLDPAKFPSVADLKALALGPAPAQVSQAPPPAPTYPSAVVIH